MFDWFQEYVTKRKIPKGKKDIVWNTYIGKDNPWGQCWVCGEKIHYQSFEVGHNRAKSQGGSDNISNLRPICSACNRRMGTMTLETYKARYYPTQSGQKTENKQTKKKTLKTTTKKATAKKSTQRKTTAKKVAPKKTTAKKPAPKKATIKKTAPKRTSAKKTTTKKPTHKRRSRKKTVAKRASAKKTSTRKTTSKKK